jgi:hypothetical protein
MKLMIQHFFLSKHDEVIQTEFVEWGLDSKALEAFPSDTIETTPAQFRHHGL